MTSNKSKRLKTKTAVSVERSALGWLVSFAQDDQTLVKLATTRLYRAMRANETVLKHSAYSPLTVEKMISALYRANPKDESFGLAVVVLWEIAGRCQDLTQITVSQI